MTHLPGNPHAVDAQYAMECTILSSDDSGTQAIESLLMDNARANLAVAHELRTLTMAVMASINPAWYGSTGPEQFAEINARMGNPEGATR